MVNNFRFTPSSTHSWQLCQLWQLFDNFLTTFWHFLVFFWQLFDNFLTTFWQLIYNFFTTFLTTFGLHFDNFLTTFLTTFGQYSFLLFDTMWHYNTFVTPQVFIGLLRVDYRVRFSCPSNRFLHPTNRFSQSLAHQCRMPLRQTVCRT
jgi:hypothetical protein